MNSIVKSRYHWTSNVAGVVIGALGVIAFTGCGDDDTTIIIPPPTEHDAGLDAGGTDTTTGTGDPTSEPTDTETTEPDPTGGETSDDDAGVTDPTSTDEETDPTDTSSDTSDETSTEGTGIIPPDAGGGNNDPDASVDPGEATQPPEGAHVLTTFANPGTKSNDGAGILMTGAKEEADPASLTSLSGFAVSNSIATFEANFTGQVQSYRIQLPTNFDATGHKLLVRLRVLSSMETETAGPAVQLASWSGGWGWNDTYNAITEESFDWVVYEMDMDTVNDPADLQAVGFQITTGGWDDDGLEYSDPDSVTFQVDWVAFVPKPAAPDGGTGDEVDGGPDAGWDDDDAGWDDDAGVPDGGDELEDDGGLADVGEDAPADAVYVVTNMDGALSTGYANPEGSLATETSVSFYNSIARFATPFSAENQDYRVLFGVGNQDFSGHDVAIRFRIISGLVAGTYPGLQLISWSDGYKFGNKWISINGNDDYSSWAVYRVSLDEISEDAEAVDALGFAVATGGDPGAFEEMVYEVDWIAVVPSEVE